MRRIMFRGRCGLHWASEGTEKGSLKLLARGRCVETYVFNAFWTYTTLKLKKLATGGASGLCRVCVLGLGC